MSMWWVTAYFLRRRVLLVEMEDSWAFFQTSWIGSPHRQTDWIDPEGACVAVTTSDGRGAPHRLQNPSRASTPNGGDTHHRHSRKLSGPPTEMRSRTYESATGISGTCGAMARVERGVWSWVPQQQCCSTSGTHGCHKRDMGAVIA